MVNLTEHCQRLNLPFLIIHGIINVAETVFISIIAFASLSKLILKLKNTSFPRYLNATLFLFYIVTALFSLVQIVLSCFQCLFFSNTDAFIATVILLRILHVSAFEVISFFRLKHVFDHTVHDISGSKTLSFMLCVVLLTLCSIACALCYLLRSSEWSDAILRSAGTLLISKLAFSVWNTWTITRKLEIVNRESIFHGAGLSIQNIEMYRNQQTNGLTEDELLQTLTKHSILAAASCLSTALWIAADLVFVLGVRSLYFQVLILGFVMNLGALLDVICMSLSFYRRYYMFWCHSVDLKCKLYCIARAAARVEATSRQDRLRVLPPPVMSTSSYTSLTREGDSSDVY